MEECLYFYSVSKIKDGEISHNLPFVAVGDNSAISMVLGTLEMHKEDVITEDMYVVCIGRYFPCSTSAVCPLSDPDDYRVLVSLGDLLKKLKKEDF